MMKQVNQVIVIDLVITVLIITDKKTKLDYIMCFSNSCHNCEFRLSKRLLYCSYQNVLSLLDIYEG